MQSPAKHEDAHVYARTLIVSYQMHIPLPAMAPRLQESTVSWLVGVWSPIIHAPPVKPVTVLSMETSHPYLTKTFQSELSSEHISGVFLLLFLTEQLKC